MPYTIALTDEDRAEVARARAEIKARKQRERAQGAPTFKQRNKARMAELAACRANIETATPRGNTRASSAVRIVRDKTLSLVPVAFEKPDGSKAFGRVLTRKVRVEVASR